MNKHVLRAAGVGLLLLITLGLWPADWLSKFFFLNSGICPQRPGHSYFFGEKQMPIEARMIGIFAGFALTTFILWFVGRGRAIHWPNRVTLPILLGLVGVMALDGLNATFHDLGLVTLYPPQNWLRIITGTLSGIGMAGIILPVFNQTLWKYAYDKTTFRRWWEIALMLIPGAVIVFGTISSWEIFFWPLAVLATAGVIGMLTVFNLIIFTVAFKRENRVQSATEFLTPLTFGILFSLAELVLFATLRYMAGATPIL